MTNGTSQGLFVVVAIVIFGIFILISSLLFKDNLKPTLANIFTDGLEQSNCSLADSGESTPICNPTFNNSFEIRGDIFLVLDGYTKIIWEPNDSSIRTINLKNHSAEENDTVEIVSIIDNKVTVKQPFLDNGFGKDKSRKAFISINGQPEIELGVTYDDNASWGNNKHLKLKIGQINAIKLTYENVYGGKTTYTFQVNIINE